MAAITADIAIKLDDAEKRRMSVADRFDMALAMHLAATRFCSPAGIAFLPQSYLPFLTRKLG